MSENDIQSLIELAKIKLEEAKLMNKSQAIRSLNLAGILTTKGQFKKGYRLLEQIVVK